MLFNFLQTFFVVVVLNYWLIQSTQSGQQKIIFDGSIPSLLANFGKYWPNIVLREAYKSGTIFFRIYLLASKMKLSFH